MRKLAEDDAAQDSSESDSARALQLGSSRASAGQNVGAAPLQLVKGGGAGGGHGGGRSRSTRGVRGQPRLHCQDRGAGARAAGRGFVAGADMPLDITASAQNSRRPCHWPAVNDRAGWHAAGYKLLVREASLDDSQIGDWLVRKSCPRPVEIENAKESQSGGKQLCLTFARQEDAIIAKRALDADALESSACLTQTAWWQPSDGR